MRPAVRSRALLAALLLGSASVSGEPAPTVAYLGETETFWQVFVMRPDGGGRRQLTTSPGDKTRASWYPDGKALLVSSQRGTLAKVDLATGAEEPLRLPMQGTYDAALSPDGSKIAFSMSPAQARDNNEVFVVGADGTGLRKLTRIAGLQDEPAWSADGRWIYFHAGEGSSDDHDIVRIAPDGTGQEQLTAGMGFHFEVAIAKDGALAFSSNRSGNYELYVQEPGVAEAKALTDHPAADGAPAWSPDARTLLFESSRGGSHGLWSIARGGGKPEPVPTGGAARRPAWLAAPTNGAAR
jgi:TolB protein